MSVAFNHKIAGFVACAEKQKRSAGDRLQNSARHQFFLRAHIMIQCFDSNDPARTPPSGIVADMHGRLGVYADSHGFRIRICQCIYLPDVFKDGVGFCGFF